MNEGNVPVGAGLDQVDFELSHNGGQPLDENVAIAVAFHAADDGHAVILEDDDAQVGIVTGSE